MGNKRIISVEKEIQYMNRLSTLVFSGSNRSIELSIRDVNRYKARYIINELLNEIGLGDIADIYMRI